MNLYLTSLSLACKNGMGAPFPSTQTHSDRIVPTRSAAHTCDTDGRAQAKSLKFNLQSNAELRKAHVRIHGLKDEVKELGVDKDRTAYLEKELAAMRAEKDYLKVRLDKLVSERKEAAAMVPAPNSMSEEEGEKLRLENETLKESLSRVVSELKEASDRRPPPSGNSEELDELQHANRALKKDLQEKASSLETAKLMINTICKTHWVFSKHSAMKP